MIWSLLLSFVCFFPCVGGMDRLRELAKQGREGTAGFYFCAFVKGGGALREALASRHVFVSPKCLNFFLSLSLYLPLSLHSLFSSLRSFPFSDFPFFSMCAQVCMKMATDFCSNVLYSGFPLLSSLNLFFL